MAKSKIIWINLGVNIGKWSILGVCYRSQTASELEIEEVYKAILIVSNEQVVIMGGFYYPDINLETLEADSKS